MVGHQNLANCQGNKIGWKWDHNGAQSVWGIEADNTDL